jgi:hypothetical protein
MNYQAALQKIEQAAEHVAKTSRFKILSYCSKIEQRLGKSGWIVKRYYN